MSYNFTFGWWDKDDEFPESFRTIQPPDPEIQYFSTSAERISNLFVSTIIKVHPDQDLYFIWNRANERPMSRALSRDELEPIVEAIYINTWIGTNDRKVLIAQLFMNADRYGTSDPYCTDAITWETPLVFVRNIPELTAKGAAVHRISFGEFANAVFDKDAKRILELCIDLSIPRGNEW